MIDINAPEYKRFVEVRVEILPVHFGLELLFPIGQKVDFDIGIATAGDVLDRKVSSGEDLSHNELWIDFWGKI